MEKIKEEAQMVPQTIRKSNLALTSFILAFVTILMFCALVSVYFLLVYNSTLTGIGGEMAQLGNQFAMAASYLAFCPAILGVLTALAAIAVGATSLVRKENRKGLAITGIVIGLLTGLVMCAITLILTFMSRT